MISFVIWCMNKNFIRRNILNTLAKFITALKDINKHILMTKTYFYLNIEVNILKGSMHILIKFCEYPKEL